MKTEKFLEFNGKKLTLVTDEGKFFIALKPICEVLEIDWDNHRKWLQNHKILNSVKVNITSTGADNKQYKMVCLPEKYIYGWLLSFTPKTESHIDFQKECYDILYNHFHNLLAVRHTNLDKRKELRETYHQLHLKKLNEDQDYKQMVEIEQQLKSINKNLAEYDNILLNGQMRLNF